MRAEIALRDALAVLAASLAGAASADVVVDPTPSGALLARVGDVVLKAHRVGTARAGLAARLALAADAAWSDCLLAPLDASPVVLTPQGGASRLVSVWPLVEVVPPTPEAVPWAEAGALLARLHRRAPPAPIGAHGGPARVARALAGLRGVLGPRGATAPPVPADLVAAAVDVRRAASTLPAWATTASCAGAAPGRPRTLVHGDWHLGQLGRRPGAGSPRDGASGWVLLDVDDVGLGDPAWDLARPAALLAAGLLDPVAWVAIVDAYRAGDGPALPPEPAEPWPALDAVARAAVVQGAAAVVRRAIEAGRALDDADAALVAACRALAGDQR